MPVTYKPNTKGNVQAAYSRDIHVGYVERYEEGRWMWCLNMIQPRGGRASGIVENEVDAKQQRAFC
jgi:hypothetical protein